MRQQEYEALGEITEKGLTILDLEHFRSAMRRFPVGMVTISVKVSRPRRSSSQNRYWHGVVVPLFAEHCGYDVDEMKDVLALRLLPKEITDPSTGEVLTVPGHTSALSTKEFNEPIERAQRLGSEMGIYIPDPGEVSRVA